MLVEAIRRFPGDAFLLYERSKTLRDQGEIDEAITVLKEGISARPSAQLYLTLGGLHTERRDDELLFETVEEAQSLLRGSSPRALVR